MHRKCNTNAQIEVRKELIVIVIARKLIPMWVSFPERNSLKTISSKTGNSRAILRKAMIGSLKIMSKSLLIGLLLLSERIVKNKIMNKNVMNHNIKQFFNLIQKFIFNLSYILKYWINIILKTPPPSPSSKRRGVLNPKNQYFR